MVGFAVSLCLWLGAVVRFLDVKYRGCFVGRALFLETGVREELLIGGHSLVLGICDVGGALLERHAKS